MEHRSDGAMEFSNNGVMWLNGWSTEVVEIFAIGVVV